MSENACCIFCREYIRESPEYKIILTEFLFYNEQCMDILRNRYDSYVFLWSGEELQHRQIDFPRHPLETLSLGAIIKLFSTNGLSIPNHFDYCTNDEQVSSGTDHGTIIFTGGCNICPVLLHTATFKHRPESKLALLVIDT